MRITSSDIKVNVNYPSESNKDSEIKEIIAKWIFNQQINKYGEENLEKVYPIWIEYNNKKLKDETN